MLCVVPVAIYSFQSLLGRRVTAVDSSCHSVYCACVAWNRCRVQYIMLFVYPVCSNLTLVMHVQLYMYTHTVTVYMHVVTCTITEKINHVEQYKFIHVYQISALGMLVLRTA